MKLTRKSLFADRGLIGDGRSVSPELLADLFSVAVGLETLNLLIPAACGISAVGLIYRLKEEL